jgi:hemolysin D
MAKNHRREARRELWKQYRETFSHFWANRHQLGTRVFRTDEAEFLPEALAIQERPVSKTARALGFTLMLIALFVPLWAYLGKMDIVVNATGKLIGTDYNKKIASVEVAAVRALHVREGQVVKAGEVLIELDASGSNAEHVKAKGIATEASLQMGRGKAMLDAISQNTPPRLLPMPDIPTHQWQAAQHQLNVQFAEHQSKINRIDGEIARYSQTLKLSKQRAEDYLQLSKTNDVSVHAWQEKEQSRIEIEGQLNDMRQQRTLVLEQARREAWDMLAEGRRAADASQQDAMRALEHSKLFKLTAPVDGTVQQLVVHTVGAAVPNAQPLMVIVPSESKLEVEAFVNNRDIGFVRKGQRVEVKIDAFSYSKYGTVSGHISHVSRDAIQDEKNGLLYAVKVALDKKNLTIGDEIVPLGTGLSVNVEIKTGDRRVIEYFLSPLLEHKREALNER